MFDGTIIAEGNKTQTSPCNVKPGLLLAGRYRIVRKLGAGAMGKVFLAKDAKLDGMEVALKFLSNGRDEAFKAEAKTAMRLAHPHIACIRAWEQSAAGAFIVMDYVPGETLESLLERKKRLGEKETAKILSSVADALDYAHSRGIVHRDVKPGNIMVLPDGTGTLLDFGIARDAMADATIAGTPAYMSPEQIAGAKSAPAQDIYSLGAVIYKCLAGRTPEPGRVQTLLSTSPLAAMAMAALSPDPARRPAAASAIFAPAKTLAPYGRLHFLIRAILICAIAAMLVKMFSGSGKNREKPRQDPPPAYNNAGGSVGIDLMQIKRPAAPSNADTGTGAGTAPTIPRRRARSINPNDAEALDFFNHPF